MRSSSESSASVQDGNLEALSGISAAKPCSEHGLPFSGCSTALTAFLELPAVRSFRMWSSSVPQTAHKLYFQENAFKYWGEHNNHFKLISDQQRVFFLLILSDCGAKVKALPFLGSPLTAHPAWVTIPAKELPWQAGWDKPGNKEFFLFNFSSYIVLVLRANHLPESQQMRQKYSVVDSYSSPWM